MITDIAEFKKTIFTRPIPERYEDVIKAHLGPIRTFSGFDDIRSLRSRDIASTLAKDIFQSITTDHFQDPARLKERLRSNFSKDRLIGSLKAPGDAIMRLVTGRNFVDLGCGNPDKSIFPRFIAQVFGAERYIGVDYQAVEDAVRMREFPELGEFTSHFIKSDLLSFLSKAQFKKTVFFISGLEPRWVDIQDRKISWEDICSYLDGCMTEMTRLCESDDGIILGPHTVDFPLYNHGFKKTAELPRVEGSMLSGPADHNWLTVYVKQ